MKCQNCDNEAVTFHGVMVVTHGYCAEHRCCAGCGFKVAECHCPPPSPVVRLVDSIIGRKRSGQRHTERTEYLEYLQTGTVSRL